jgi:hypothetical protein
VNNADLARAIDKAAGCATRRCQDCPLGNLYPCAVQTAQEFLVLGTVPPYWEGTAESVRVWHDPEEAKTP